MGLIFSKSACFQDSKMVKHNFLYWKMAEIAILLYEIFTTFIIQCETIFDWNTTKCHISNLKMKFYYAY